MLQKTKEWQLPTKVPKKWKLEKNQAEEGLNAQILDLVVQKPILNRTTSIKQLLLWCRNPHRLRHSRESYPLFVEAFG